MESPLSFYDVYAKEVPKLDTTFIEAANETRKQTCFSTPM